MEATYPAPAKEGMDSLSRAFDLGIEWHGNRVAQEWQLQWMAGAQPACSLWPSLSPAWTFGLRV